MCVCSNPSPDMSGFNLHWYGTAAPSGSGSLQQLHLRQRLRKRLAARGAAATWLGTAEAAAERWRIILDGTIVINGL